MKGTIVRGLGCILLTGACACAAYDDFDEELYLDDLSLRQTESTVRAEADHPGGDLWIGNGLHTPNVSGIDPDHPLDTPEGLSESLGLLVEPDHWATAQYLVECALSPEQSITKTVDGETVLLEGQLGLAPEWETEACDEDCQQWVTACLLARTNVTSETVWLGLRAHHPAIGTNDNPSFPLYEASWYGNLFAKTPEQYFCQGNPAGLLSAHRAGRTCSTGQHEDCGFTELGRCRSNDRCDYDEGTARDCVANEKTYNTISTYVDVPGQ